MPRFIVTIQDRYEVEADTAEQALGSYQVVYNNHQPDMVGINIAEVIDADNFEYLDGYARAEESN